MAKHTHHPAHPRYWLLWLGVGMHWLIGQLPWPVLQAMGRAVGWMAWRLGGRRRRIAETNIRLCFPDMNAEQQAKLVHDNMISTGMALLEMAGAYWHIRDVLKRRFEVQGMDIVEQARTSGRGVIILGMHMHSIDVACRCFADYVHLDSVYRPDDNPVMDWVIRTGRQKYVDEYIDRKDLRKMVKRLKAGHWIWYAPDQDYGVQYSVFAPFFGVPAATVTATATLARLSGALVIPMAHYRKPGGGYTVKVFPPLENFPTGDAVADATTVNQIVERAVMEHPEQYLWVHRRFKHQPPGQASPY